MDFGQDGQEDYKLILYFGTKALSRNARELDLIECIPDFGVNPEAISIDIENKTVAIHLL